MGKDDSTSSEESETNCDPRMLLKRLRKLEKERSRRHRHKGKRNKRDRNHSRSRSRKRTRTRSPSIERSEEEGFSSRGGLTPTVEPPESEKIAFSNHERSASSERVADGAELQTDNEDTLPADILNLLGMPSNVAPKMGDPVHADIAVRWDGILKQGLDPEVTKELVTKYPPIANCLLSQAPKINPEVKGAATEAALRRDERLASKQAQITACLSAVGKMLTLLLTNKNQVEQDRPLIELASDTGRLLADLHYSESESRKILIGASLNKKFQAAMGDTPRDEWLFGSDIGERLKSAKSLERSTLELKGRAFPKKPSNKESLNYNRPPNAKPTQKRSLHLGGRNYSQVRNNGPKQYQQQRSNQQQYRRQQQPRSDRPPKGARQRHFSPRKQL